jgi:hypothetical protein
VEAKTAIETHSTNLQSKYFVQSVAIDKAGIAVANLMPIYRIALDYDNRDRNFTGNVRV